MGQQRSAAGHPAHGVQQWFSRVTTSEDVG